MTDLGSVAETEFMGLQFNAADDNQIACRSAHSLPLFLPWKRTVVRLGTCFHSKLQNSMSPYLHSSPFMLSDLYMIPKMLQREDGAEVCFKSITTMHASQTGDHLSLGFGVGIGPPGLSFLANVSVKGTYDTDIQENRDSEKSSVRTSVRAGSVVMERQPCLSIEAVTLLKNGGGYEAFCNQYGDYYVAGYRLGGETGFLMSTSKLARKQDENFGVKVSVSVLFMEVSKEWNKDFHDYSAGKTLKLLGYDTLDGKNWNTTTTGNDFTTYYGEKKSLMEHSQNLLDRVSKALDVQELHDHDYLTADQCDRLIESGLVIELMLLPMAGIRDIARIVNNTDLI